MTELMKILCPSCGGKLKFDQAQDHFRCDNCGNEYMVKQTGNTLSLERLPSTSETAISGNGNVVVRVNVGGTGQSEKEIDTEEPINPPQSIQKKGNENKSIQILSGMSILLGCTAIVISIPTLISGYWYLGVLSLLFCLASFATGLRSLQKGEGTHGWIGIILSWIACLVSVLGIIGGGL
jgi:DNA-directed RNA polymerase subunit RPC12/RpoP